MLLSKEEEKRYTKRLLESRLRILCTQGFYGTLLMHMNFALNNDIKNVSVDRNKMYFNPEFLDRLNNMELDFVLMHEITHLALRHNSRKKEFEHKEIFDKAADIVVNSNILKSFHMDENKISIDGKTCPHQSLKDETEGYEYSVEKLYQEIIDNSNAKKPNNGENENNKSSKETNNNSNAAAGETNNNEGFDDHSKWEDEMDDDLDDKEWEQRVIEACEALYVRDPSNSRGQIPLFAARFYKQLMDSKTDWRTLLNNFVQEDVNDYSFTPPDRRFDDNPFFLPDFNDPDEMVKDVLFMIDTSGSMSDYGITVCYSEVKGAIDQFGGKLQGWLGFFDAAIIEPKPFTNEEEFKIIKPYGGGGTSFSIIFKYIKDHMKDKNISSVVILTDGYAPWPKEEVAMGIPVIWLINNNDSNPPWGKVARISEDINNSFN